MKEYKTSQSCSYLTTPNTAESGTSTGASSSAEDSSGAPSTQGSWEPPRKRAKHTDPTESRSLYLAQCRTGEVTPDQYDALYRQRLRKKHYNQYLASLISSELPGTGPGTSPSQTEPVAGPSSRAGTLEQKSSTSWAIDSIREKSNANLPEEPLLQFISASGAYFFNKEDQRYLDCVSGVSHVGHCHPTVVKAFESAMNSLNLRPPTGIQMAGFQSPETSYRDSLAATLPEYLKKIAFFNSGSEANDIAIQICRRVTGHKDVVVFQSSFHGSIGLGCEASPKTDLVRKKNQGEGVGLPDWVHVLPVPDLYRGPYQEDDPEAYEKYFQEAKKILDDKVKDGRKIACLLTEPMFTFHALTVPSGEFLEKICSYVRQLGGLIVIDEVQCGMGRLGSHFWAFQKLGLNPDILTTGKPMGNGYPMSLLATTEKIFSQVEDIMKRHLFLSPIQNQVGNAVLQVIREEKLQENAKQVGEAIIQSVKRMKSIHPNIGDVRGLGLLIGIDLVRNQESRSPAPNIAEALLYRFREEKIIISVEGNFDNAIILIPPLCFSADNAKQFLTHLDKFLHEIEENPELIDKKHYRRHKRHRPPSDSKSNQEASPPHHHRFCNEQVSSSETSSSGGGSPGKGEDSSSSGDLNKFDEMD